MKVQIRRLDVNQMGALFAYVMGFLILLFSPIVILKAIFEHNVIEVLFGIPLVLLFYVVFSFFMGLIFAKLYNRAASKVGGLKMELDIESESTEPTSTDKFCSDG